MNNQAAPAFLVFLSFTLSLTTGSGAARAACTAIPDAGSSFRGTVGSIDRPFARPGEDNDILTLSNACGSEQFTDTNGDGVVDAEDFDVTIIAKPPGAGGPHALVLRGAGDCAAVGPELAQLKKELQGRAPICKPGATAKPSSAVPGASGQPQETLRLQLPEVDFAGPATIVVTRPKAPIPIGLVKQGCAKAGKSGRLVCIDQLFTSAGGNCGTSPDDVEPLFQEFLLLPPVNDYQLICSPEWFQGKPKCTGTANELFYTVNGKGDLRLHMRWENILQPKAGSSDFVLRDVLGSSAVEAFDNQGEPIHVPGAAFLKSFNPAGASFTRQPLFLPVEGVRPNELTLRGDADKGRSVLHIARRLPWMYACSGGSNDGQACETNPQEYPGVGDCPQGTCGMQPPARIFACVGGERDKAPCTRPRQCPGGECRAGSQCYTLAGTPTFQPCTRDSDCQGNKECGAGLFEFRDRVTNGIGTVPRIAGGQFEGVCEGGWIVDGLKCVGPSCLPGLVSCVVFRAEAKN
jgi:hypothetical protein